jgi:hypothetical protein
MIQVNGHGGRSSVSILLFSRKLWGTVRVEYTAHRYTAAARKIDVLVFFLIQNNISTIVLIVIVTFKFI